MANVRTLKNRIQTDTAKVCLSHLQMKRPTFQKFCTNKRIQLTEILHLHLEMSGRLKDKHKSIFTHTKDYQEIKPDRGKNHFRFS